MNKAFVFKLCAALCMLALLACSAMIFLRNFRIGYANADRYNAGAAIVEGKVENLDINWTSGTVNIAWHDGNNVEISETATRDISEAEALRWWLDGTTLRIRFTKSGFFSLRSLNKALTVTLPTGIVLENVNIEATSADVTIPDLQVNALSVSLTSGDLELAQSGSSNSIALSSTSGDLHVRLEEAKAVFISTTSGKIALEQTDAADSVLLSSTSGDIRIALDSVNTLNASATSGSISLQANAVHNARLDSTSGTLIAALAAFDDLQIDSTSGNVTAALNALPGFTADIGTASGAFDSAIALKQDGSRYACGDESASLRIHTTSGDIRLEEAAQAIPHISGQE